MLACREDGGCGILWAGCSLPRTVGGVLHYFPIYTIEAWVDQKATASRYLAASRGTPLPPSCLPRALRIIVIGYGAMSALHEDVIERTHFLY